MSKSLYCKQEKTAEGKILEDLDNGKIYHVYRLNHLKLLPHQIFVYGTIH